MTFQFQENIFLEFISRKLHITYSFVIQRITWKDSLGIIFLENRISVTQKSVFGINFAIISGWSVETLGALALIFRDLLILGGGGGGAKKNNEIPEESKEFSLCETTKILGKERKHTHTHTHTHTRAHTHTHTHLKRKESQKENARKSQKARKGG